MGRLTQDYGHNLYSTWKQSGTQKSFNEWLKDLKKNAFNSSTADKYYTDIKKYFSDFSTLYEYIEKFSDKIGYKTSTAIDIKTDITKRILYIQEITGLDQDFLTQLFKINDLENIIDNLTTLSSEGYIFAGEQFGALPNHTELSELIGVKVSNGRNKTTIENFLLNKEQSLQFTKAMQNSGKMVLMPMRDENGKIIDFNFGLKGSGRYNIRDTLLEITGGQSEQLPIDYKDSIAVKIVNAILNGKTVDVGQMSINFATKTIGANYGERSEALVEAIYKQYNLTGQVLSGDILTDIVQTQLISMQINENGQEIPKFNIPAGTSGLAAEDFILETFALGQYQNVPVQNKNIGDSVRYSYGSILGVQQINGFYAGRGLFNQDVNQVLSQQYQQLQQEERQQVLTFASQVNSDFKSLLFSTLANQGIDITGLDEEIISADEATDLLIDATSEFMI